MVDRPQMAHVDVRVRRGRFRLRFPTTYEAVAVILSLGCAIKDIPPDAWAALSAWIVAI